MAYITLDRGKSPTAAAVQIFNDLAGQGADVVNLGQGREIDDPKGKLGKLLSGHLKTKSQYNVAPAQLNDTAAHWLRRFLGIPATGDNTFVLQKLGREALGQAFSVAAYPHGGKGYKPAVLVPQTRWPMLDEIIDGERMQGQSYAVRRGNLAGEIKNQLRIAADEVIDVDGRRYSAEKSLLMAHVDNIRPDQEYIHTAMKDIPADYVIGAAYFNFPHNPTGMEVSVEENSAIMAVLDDANSKGRHKIMRIDDMPYFGGCEQKAVKKGGGAYLKTGYEGVLKADSLTPWAMAVSFSKALGTASPGLSILVVHPRMAADMRKRMVHASNLSFDPDFYRNLTALFDPKRDKDILRHFGQLRAKYVKNRATAEKALGAMVVDGDPGMTSLVALPSTVFNKAVQCSDGQTRDIYDLNDIVEFLANEGVVTVNNGGNLLRIAQAAKPKQFKDGVKRLQAGLAKLENAPAIIP